MVFNSDVFLFAFLPAVFALFWLSRTKRARYVLLGLAGYVFYGWWDWRFCFLLLFSTVVSFLTGLAIDGSRDERIGRRWMGLAVSVDLSLLGFFKYYNFAAANVRSLVSGVHLPILHVVLPIGISFYTFHTISYVVDVYAKRVKATRNLWEYMTYVNLFSQLVAGPIVRFRQIEGDLEHIDGPPNEDWIARGIGFFVVGLIKKVVLADHIAHGVDPLLASYATMSTADAWVAALGYTCQLYFDFSGYSDMAVGLGYLFGLRIPQNFNAPYRALGITDFWRRWHISLSTWLRDYLYIPLGGNRKGSGRTYVNLMLTMLLGGLWHGANWTFVAWGGYHGGLLIAERVGQGWYRRFPPWLYRLLTFLLVVFGWVLFRSQSFSMAATWLRKMLSFSGAAVSVSSNTLAWISVSLLAVAFLPETWDVRFPTARRWAPVYATAFLFAYFFMNGTETVFLYYQF